MRPVLAGRVCLRGPAVPAAHAYEVAVLAHVVSLACIGSSWSSRVGVASESCAHFTHSVHCLTEHCLVNGTGPRVSKIIEVVDHYLARPLAGRLLVSERIDAKLEIGDLFLLSAVVGLEVDHDDLVR